MQRLRWNTLLAIFILIGVCHTVLGAPNSLLRIKRSNDIDITDVSDLNPVESEDSIADGSDRNKRLVDTSVHGGKNALLGYVFSASKSSAIGSIKPVTQAPVITTTDDTPDFDRNRVSLDIPDKLFGSSFSTVTTVSKIFGELIMNSARRYSQFVQFFKPLLGKHLTVKGYKIVATTTTTESSVMDDDDV